MTEANRENGHNPKYLYEGYIVAVAMSPKGKNLLNKAYSSFKNKSNSSQVTQSVSNTFFDDSQLSESSYASSNYSRSTQDINEFRSMLGQLDGGIYGK